MLRHTTPVLFLTLMFACTRSGDLSHEEGQGLAADHASRAHGELVQGCDIPQGDRSMEPPADGIYDQGGCRILVYTTGQFGETVPPGWSIAYCVCQDMPSNDPLSGPLDGGWTYPLTTCQHDWSNH